MHLFIPYLSTACVQTHHFLFRWCDGDGGGFGYEKWKSKQLFQFIFQFIIIGLIKEMAVCVCAENANINRQSYIHSKHFNIKFVGN